MCNLYPLGIQMQPNRSTQSHGVLPKRPSGSLYQAVSGCHGKLPDQVSQADSQTVSGSVVGWFAPPPPHAFLTYFDVGVGYVSKP